ncbi:hypothetical protein B566_EDAN016374 [Ephemera danica]|nr:hypothetical protein B566_EDAN016374 [Ephemera danica]
MSDFYRNLSRDALGDEDLSDDDGNLNKFIAFSNYFHKMSDFYRNLSRDALGDEDLSDDDGNLNKFIGDMDDLDAALFGLPVKKLTPSAPIAVPSTERNTQQLPFKSTLSSANDLKRSQGSSKSQLMAELFGDSNQQEQKLSIPPPVTTQEKKLDFDLSIRPKTSPERSNIGFESLTYQPSSVEQRERRRQPVQETKGAAMDDLWSKFLQVDTPDVSKGQLSSIPQDIESKTEKYPSNIAETRDIIESPNMSATSTAKRRAPPGKNTRAPLVHSNSEDTILNSFITRKPLRDEKPQSSLEQFEGLKPLIETMINDKLIAIDSESRKYATRFDELEAKLENYNSSMMPQETLQELEDKILLQSTKIQVKCSDFVLWLC